MRRPRSSARRSAISSTGWCRTSSWTRAGWWSRTPGLKERYQGRASGRVRPFALYGETTGEPDEFGLPVRYNWAADYRGSAAVVYGHTPVPDAEWVNNAICVDTGCVFGGKLTALRWPERALVSVLAARVYYQPAKPFPSGGVAARGAAG